MFFFRFVIFSFLFINCNGLVEQKYNESDYEAVQKRLGIPLPTFKIPDLLNPDKSDTDDSPSIRKQIPRENLIKIGLPTLPHLLPTALPNIKIPTIKIPDIIPKTLPTLSPIKIPTLAPIKLPTIKMPTLPHLLPTAIPTFKIPTIKLPTFPHILPTAFPTFFPKPTVPTEGITPKTPYTLPYPLPSDIAPIPFLSNDTSPGSNLICDICENAVTVVKARFFKFEKAVRTKISDVLGKVCDMLNNNPATMIFATPCNMFKLNIIDKAFKELDKFEDSIQPKTFCKHVPFCK